jgi:hypothetical protein
MPTACHGGVRWSTSRAARYSTAISVARHTDALVVTTCAYATRSSSVRHAAGRPVTPHTSSTPTTSAARIAMLPPEMAMT